jgi:hypothetical protein
MLNLISPVQPRLFELTHRALEAPTSRLVRVMQPTDEIQPTKVPSALADLRRIPLTEMSALGHGVLRHIMQRALPGSPVTPAPGTPFNSAI